MIQHFSLIIPRGKMFRRATQQQGLRITDNPIALVMVTFVAAATESPISIHYPLARARSQWKIID